VLEKLLRCKRDKDCSRGSCQPTLDFHLIDADGERGHQPFLLLKVQTLERTVVFLSDGGSLENGILKLLAGVRSVHQDDCHEEHPLISRLEILQKPLCFTAKGCKVRRDDVHVVAGPDSLLLLFNLHLVEIRDFRLDALDCLRLINSPDMKIDRDVAVHVEEISQHTVIEFRRENLQKADRANGFAHLEALSFAEVKRSGGDEVLRAKPGASHHIEGEAERLIGVHVEHIMQHLQPFIAGKRLGFYAECLEIVQDVAFNALKLGLRGTQRVCLNTKGDVLALEQAVVAFGKLFL